MPKKLPQIVREIQNNPPQEVNYAFQKNISYSQMNMFRSCPHRWKLQYKDKLKPFTSSIHTVFGTAIHETIQEYLDVMYNTTKVAADELDLESNFQEYFIKEYQKQYKSNTSEHFSTAEEMREFFEDGVAILDTFKKKLGGYFSKRNTYLVGCEIPIVIAPNKMYNNVLYMGFLDVVLYNENTEEFTIIDIKTSTRGWKDKDKKDENKQYQLLLYKQFFADQYHIPLDKINVEFFIVKRKIWESSDFNISRIQTFSPPSGKIKLGRANKAVQEFINECFNTNGDPKDIDYPKSPSKWNCGFCPFKEDKENCGAGLTL